MTIKRRAPLTLGILVLSALWAFSALAGQLVVKDGKTFHQYPLMRPDRATFEHWIQLYQQAPRRPDASLTVRDIRTSVSLLDLLDYRPTERNQGQCGNCWVWSGNGALGIHLNLQTGTRDRLSVQYPSSCNTEKSCCDGGWLDDLASFYTTVGFAIPWSNANAEWQNGDGSCNGDCAAIATSPQYSFDSISAQTVTTQGVGQAQAIANIKSALNNNQPVWYAFFLANTSAWNAFYDFWDNGGRTDVFDFSLYSGATSDEGLAGHAVLIVGYDDTASVPYWVVLNSWGTTSTRLDGTFRMKMEQNYDHYFQDGSYLYYGQYFQTLDVAFTGGKSSCPSSISPLNQTFTADPHSATIAVSADSSCSWTAAESLDWVNITSGTAGTGNGTVAFSLTANPQTSSRSGTITIGDKSFLINQTAAGAECAYHLSSSYHEFPASGGTGSFEIVAATGCDWTAASNSTWITITSGTSGSGNATIGYTVEANADATGRSGTIAIAGETHWVAQEGTERGLVSFSNQSCARNGSTLTINATVNNAWDTPLSGYEIYVFAMEDNYDCSGDISAYVLGRADVSEVPAGGSVSVNQQVALESELTGDWYVIMLLVSGEYFLDCSNEGRYDMSSSWNTASGGTASNDDDEDGGGGCFLLKSGF